MPPSCINAVELIARHVSLNTYYASLINLSPLPSNTPDEKGLFFPDFRVDGDRPRRGEAFLGKWKFSLTHTGNWQKCQKVEKPRLNSRLNSTFREIGHATPLRLSIFQWREKVPSPAAVE
jgi:hypothetical protein